MSRAVHCVAALLCGLLAACNKQPDFVGVTPQASAPAAASAAGASPASGAASSSAAAASAGTATTGVLVAASAPAAPTDAQRQAGAQLASQGGGGAVAACQSCHGAQGEGQPQAGFPRIAGQSWAYLQHQLQAYADGSRNHPVMGPIAKAMNEDQRRAAAAYYASLAPGAAAAGSSAGSSAGLAPASAAASATPSATARSTARAPAPAPSRTPAATRGETLARMGDEGKGVQACANCHGPDGAGSGQAYPALAGQHESYLVATLKAWRDGSRHSDPSGAMPVIAKSLDDADTAAVAAWYAGLPPPPVARDAARQALAPFRSALAAVQSGPASAAGATAPQGKGTEQGSPVGGGGQGQGTGGGTGGGTQGSSGQAGVAPGAAAGASPASR